MIRYFLKADYEFCTNCYNPSQLILTKLNSPWVSLHSGRCFNISPSRYQMTSSRIVGFPDMISQMRVTFMWSVSKMGLGELMLRRTSGLSIGNIIWMNSCFSLKFCSLNQVTVVIACLAAKKLPMLLYLSDSILPLYAT